MSNPYEAPLAAIHHAQTPEQVLGQLRRSMRAHALVASSAAATTVTFTALCVDVVHRAGVRAQERRAPGVPLQDLELGAGFLIAAAGAVVAALLAVAAWRMWTLQDGGRRLAWGVVLVESTLMCVFLPFAAHLAWRLTRPGAADIFRDREAVRAPFPVLASLLAMVVVTLNVLLWGVIVRVATGG